LGKDLESFGGSIVEVFGCCEKIVRVVGE